MKFTNGKKYKFTGKRKFAEITYFWEKDVNEERTHVIVNWYQKRGSKKQVDWSYFDKGDTLSGIYQEETKTFSLIDGIRDDVYWEGTGIWSVESFEFEDIDKVEEDFEIEELK